MIADTLEVHVVGGSFLLTLSDCPCPESLAGVECEQFIRASPWLSS